MSLPSSFRPSVVTLWFVTASLPLFTDTARPALCRNSSRSFWTEENKANWENVPPWKRVSCCGCDSSVAGTWSWVSWGGQGSWSVPRGLRAVDLILQRARGVWHTEPGTVRLLRSRHPAPGDTAEGLVQAKEKIPTAIREVERPPFSLSPPCWRERWVFAVLRPPAADGRGVVPVPVPLLSSRWARALRTGERISRWWLFGDSAACERRFGGCELCVSTFIMQQAPFCLWGRSLLLLS